MKVIDLLNKIANGEETPAKFIHDGYTYTENKYGMYKDEEDDDLMSNICFDFSDLNAEIEIIEDKPKHIEEIKAKYTSQVGKLELANKINELSKAVNYLLDKEGK